MSDAETWKLDDLAEKAGVSARTVRYYVQRGLLPPPVFRGKDSSYGPDHLVRLRAIARLQAEFLPLDAIQTAFDQRSLAEIERLADGRASLRPPLIAPTPPPAEVLPARRWERIALAPGVELHVAEGASRESLDLARRIRELAARPAGRGGTRL